MVQSLHHLITIGHSSIHPVSSPILIIIHSLIALDVFIHHSQSFVRLLFLGGRYKWNFTPAQIHFGPYKNFRCCLHVKGEVKSDAGLASLLWQMLSEIIAFGEIRYDDTNICKTMAEIYTGGTNLLWKK